MKPHVERAAERFHDANPHVYEKLVEIAKAVKRRGYRRIGMQLIFERLRWMSMMETEGDPYKINNNHAAWYARRLMTFEPDLAGLFQTRDGAHDSDYNERVVMAGLDEESEEWMPPF